MGDAFVLLTRQIIAAAAACCLAGPVSAAHFWLTTNGVATPGPVVTKPTLKVGVLTTFYIWGRPTEGRQFDGISLTVVASTTDVDFEDGSYTFYNTIDGGTDRFELVRDSSTTPDLNSNFDVPEIGLGFPDVLSGINGITLEDDPAYRGPGSACAEGEANCVIAGDGDPAWLIASFGVRPLSTTAETNLYLQVGDRGFLERELADGDYDLDSEVDTDDRTVWADSYGSNSLLAADGNGDGVVNAADFTLWRDHLGDTATLLDLDDTDVRFGVDTMGGDEPTYDSESLLEREWTHPDDDPDAVIEIVLASLTIPEPTAGVLLAMVLVLPISKRHCYPTRNHARI